MKIKRVVAAMLFVCLLINCIPPVQTNASSASYAYEVVSGKVTITECDKSSYGDIVIPSTLGGYPVTKIGFRAFENCTGITSVVIPEGVTEIEARAFAGCSSLTSVTIPKSLTHSWSSVFEMCYAMRSVYISDLEAWCNVEFYNSDSNPLGQNPWCTLYINGNQVTELVIPDGVEEIKFCSFFCLNSMTSLVIPASVSKIETAAFRNCYNLTKVTYCGTEETWNHVVIEEYNSYITSAALQYHDYQGATCTVAGTCVYCGAKGSPLGHSYHAVVTPPTCTSQGYTTHTCATCGDVYTDTYVAMQDHSYESVVTAPICNAGGYTTYTCTVCGYSYVADYTDAAHPYQAVVTPPTCTDKGYTTYTCALCGDSYKDNYVLPGHNYESVVTAPTCTNKGYTTHTCVGCGDSYADTYVPVLGHNYETAVTAPTCTADGYTTHTCTRCGDSYADTYVPMLGHSYDFVINAATCVNDGNGPHTCTRCGDTYEEVPPEIGHDCRNDGICAYCGYDCVNAFTYSITRDKVTIDDCDENFCGKLRIPETIEGYPVTTIGNFAFDNCTGMTSVIIPDSVTTVGGAAFSGCSNLTSVVIGNSVTAIDQSTFYDCNSLTQVEIGHSVTDIGRNAFENCTSLTSVVIPDSVTSIGWDAFWNCAGLTTVAIPDSVTTISDYAFYLCAGLTKVIYCGTEQQWNQISIGYDNSKLTNASRRYHDYQNGACTICGAAGVHEHTWENGVCTACGEAENHDHTWENGACTGCEQVLAEAIELSGDGKISAFDAQILAEAQAGLRTLTDEQWQALGALKVSDIIDYILGRFPGMKTEE